MVKRYILTLNLELDTKSTTLHKGPGWFPGLPRLGDNDLCPEIPEREKHYSGISGLTHLYLVTQLLGVFIVHDDLSRYVKSDH